MEKEETQTITSSEKTYVIHVKVINGSQADIYEIGNAMKEWKKNLPFKLEALVTNDKVELQDVDTMIKELVKLKKMIENERRI